MPADRQLLAIYRLRDLIDGTPIQSLDQAIDPDADLLEHDLQVDANFDARLFVARSKTHAPEWATFLRSGFGNLPEVLDVVINGAVIVLRLQYRRRAIVFAICFAQGRHYLKPNSFVRDFGLKVSLNAIYKGLPTRARLDPSRVRSVDAKTVGEHVIYTRRQTDRSFAI